MAGFVSNLLKSLGLSKSSLERIPSGGSLPTLQHDPRRYKRALLFSGRHGIQHQIASASAVFRKRSYPVVDLSHTGVAFERGDLTDAEISGFSKPEPIVLACGLLQPVTVLVKPARNSERVAAFEFADISTDARVLIDRFLDPKMIGLNMRLVDRSFFSPGETFSLWYCGPRDTNFFLWTKDDAVERAIVQLGEDQFSILRGAGPLGSVKEKREAVHFALDVALQVRGGGEAIADFVSLLTQVADSIEARN